LRWSGRGVPVRCKSFLKSNELYGSECVAAKEKLHKGQVPFIDLLLQSLGTEPKEYEAAHAPPKHCKFLRRQMDSITIEQRSRIMRKVKSKDTSPERIIRSLLHKMGYRFRLHRKDLPGNPDIVLPKFQSVIFVHGCFWHRHRGCAKTRTPKSNVNFWRRKFAVNIKRDRRNYKLLKNKGWRVMIIWECEVDGHGANGLPEKLNMFLSGNFYLHNSVDSQYQIAAETEGCYK